MNGLYDYKKFAILYVDDEEKSLKYFTLAFEPCFRIFTATNAEDGFRILEVTLPAKDAKGNALVGLEAVRVYYLPMSNARPSAASSISSPALVTAETKQVSANPSGSAQGWDPARSDLFRATMTGTVAPPNSSTS